MKFRAEHYAYCCQHRTLPRKELTERFNAHFGTNHSVSTINTYCKRNGILTGRKGRYGPGHTPRRQRAAASLWIQKRKQMLERKTRWQHPHGQGRLPNSQNCPKPMAAIA